MSFHGILRRVAVTAMLLSLVPGSPRAAAPAKAPAAGSAPAKAFAMPAVFPVQLIETRPVETALGNPSLPTALETWVALIRGARRTLDLEQFYLSTWPGEPMDEVMAALGSAAARGVKIRLILDRRMVRTYPRAADSLAKVAGWQVRLVDFGRIAGGVQHAKFFLVDGEIAVVGSQNFDWRSLKHIHEVGVVVRDARVAGDFQQVFEMDWNASPPAGVPADTTRREFLAPPRNPALPLPYAIVQSPGDTVWMWPSWTPKRFIPDTAMWDLDRIVRTLDGARHEVAVQIYSYSTSGRNESLPAIDEALRRAAARGVQVKMVVPDWTIGGGGFKALLDLAAVPNVSIRISSLPEWSGGYIPFARVEHCKYMVVDSLWTWVGTDNWEPGYFLGTRNLALTMRNAPIARQARAIFESSWSAPTTAPLDPKATYAPRPHGEDAPAGRTKYGG